MSLAQAAELGVLQLHLSGGEPTVRRDLAQIIAQAASVGLYSNLITAGVLLTRERLEDLAAAASITCRFRSGTAAPPMPTALRTMRGDMAKSGR